MSSVQDALACADTALKQLTVIHEEQSQVQSTLDTDAAKTKLQHQYAALKVITLPQPVLSMFV